MAFNFACTKDARFGARNLDCVVFLGRGAARCLFEVTFPHERVFLSHDARFRFFSNLVAILIRGFEDALHVVLAYRRLNFGFQLRIGGEKREKSKSHCHKNNSQKREADDNEAPGIQVPGFVFTLLHEAIKLVNPGFLQSTTLIAEVVPAFYDLPAVQTN